MARKPVPGSDGNNWGTILNEHLDYQAAQVAAVEAKADRAESRTLDSRNYASLQDFLDDVSLTKTPGRIYPGTYDVAAPLAVGSNSVIDMHGVVLEDHNPVLEGTGEQRFQNVLDLYSVENVTIRGGEINGRKASFGHSEYKSGIGIRASSNVRVEDVHAHDCKGDGILIIGAHYDTTPAPSRNVTIHRVNCENNYRQGMSIVFADGVTVTESRFAGSAGTSPEAGVDLETYPGLESFRNISFEDCIFEGNAGSGFSLIEFDTTFPSRDVTLARCVVRENITGVFITGGNRTWILDNTIHDNTVNGVLIHASNHTRVRGNEIFGNGDDGIYCQPYSGVLGNVATCDVLVIDGNTITDNAQITTTKAGFRIFNGTVNGLSVVRNTTSGNGTGGGIVFEQYEGATTITNLTVADNQFMDGAAIGVTVAVKRIHDNIGLADSTSG